ncbi:MAG: DUF1349 domain-containing protein [Candidatus Hydrogenedentes bacterium]|nr:DUF1349 domain-containing protein [Candidatus Hydrogenedentota bacterium]
MKLKLIGVGLLLTLACAPSGGETVLFEDTFKGKLGEGWSWLREDPEYWRVGDRGLEIRIEPGNMWGNQNDAKNILRRPIPITQGGATAISVTVENTPSNQYEQVDLVWYFDDSHMVKIGLEQVNKKLSLVMGREENDNPRTIALLDVASTKLELRLTVRDRQIRGEYRAPGEAAWSLAGECDLPAKGLPYVTIQTYQGLAEVEHWARLTDFRMVHTKE